MQSMLSREAVHNGLRSISGLAQRLHVDRNRLRAWLKHGVMPNRKSLKHIAEVTGNQKFISLRKSK
jgi:hypothetical protein